MTEYRIFSIMIQNFCGIKSLEISPNGSDLTIFGDNATGKTTVANAFSWLFTGKNASGTADLDPAPLDQDNSKIHNLETSVSVEFTDGTDYRRVLTEVWSKKRGAVTVELTGTKTSYYINSVPCKEKEFIAAVEERFGQAEQFRQLSIASYFASAIDWKSRRKTLIEMCGDVADDYVISESELAELPAILNGHSVEEYQKIAKSKKAEIKKELDMIPARITENQAADEAVPPESSVPCLKSQADELEARLAEISQERVKSENADNPFSDKVKAAKEAIENARSAFLKEYNVRLTEHNSRLKQLTERKNEIFSQRSPLLVKAVQIPKNINDMSKRRETLRAKRDEIKGQNYSGGNICPCCGQQLPPEQIEKAVAKFNREKSEQLEAITREGQSTCSKDMIAAAQKELDDLNINIERLSAEYDAVLKEIEDLGAAPGGDFEETEEYFRLKQEYTTAEREMISAKPSDILAKLDADREECSERLHGIRTKLAAYDAAEARRRRVSELEAQQQELSAAYADYEKGEYLCEKFIRAKVSMLDERINSRFRTLKFKLFHEQQNGGLQEICKVLIPCESGLVEYEKANNAAKINAGLEIIDALSEYYAVRLPVFVDNAESVTALNRISSQTIRLVVSEADKQLRVEYGE